ncbi:hypothetical protein IB211_03012 [Intestinimonas butyriciproducens]|uniref:Uncharacterized protein n=1 Tax=Intestinimonas butyriciproducens TaxID=1297617 RepID=A0A0S2W7V7_9FIRM|nr:hypothetical protein IB211_03012 [Intestinimonas butyriciproducens]
MGSPSPCACDPMAVPAAGGTMAFLLCLRTAKNVPHPVLDGGRKTLVF